jgi:hypothetical protein
MLCANGHGTIAVVPWLRSNKCETAAPAATNLQHAKQLMPRKNSQSREIQGTIMPILFYIAMWSCALGMASSLMPRLGPDRDNRW